MKAIMSSFPVLFGVSFYDNRQREGAEGYYLEKLSRNELPWQWYVPLGIVGQMKSGVSPVRAFKLEHPMRVAGVQIDQGSAVFEADEGNWLVTDNHKIWVVDEEEFRLFFLPLKSILELLDDRGLVGEAAGWSRNERTDNG